MQTKRSFMRAAVIGFSNDSRSITWHQWQGAYPMESRIGLSSSRARASASSPHGYQSTGFSACWRRYGLVSCASRFTALYGNGVTLPGGTVTFLFTDIEGSTRLLQELGDEYGQVVADHRRLLRGVFAPAGGAGGGTPGGPVFFPVTPAPRPLSAA